MTKPIAVCISDLHFNPTTLKIAYNALKSAITKAEELYVPLVIAGDLHDTKAIIRAEVANALIKLLEPARCPVYLIVGNHDKINEKGLDHGLNYLKPYVTLVNTQYIMTDIPTNVYLLAYQSDKEELKRQLKLIKPGSIVIMHQGIQGAFMGDYIQDHTSIETSYIDHVTAISGHYHKHQTVGNLTYIGSPYTISFGESNDGPKGYLILNEDGSFIREILNLRKHVILDIDFNKPYTRSVNINPEDLLWVKVTGTDQELATLNKESFGQALIGHNNFRLDKISTSKFEAPIKTKDLTNNEILDQIIDESSESDTQKLYLKNLWREILK